MEDGVSVAIAVLGGDSHYHLTDSNGRAHLVIAEGNKVPHGLWGGGPKQPNDDSFCTPPLNLQV